MNPRGEGQSLRHILVVDDQGANRAGLEQILGDLYRISLTENGREGLDLVRRLRPDLVLLDVDTPLVDGLTLCRKLKEDPQTLPIPVIFISALCGLEERLEAYRAGADDYVTKPYAGDELLAKIRIVLNNHHDLESACKRARQGYGSPADSQAPCNELEALRRFIGDALGCSDLRTIGDCLLRTFDRFGLRVVVRLSGSGHYFSHGGEVGALEREMMETMHDKERCIDFGHRRLINADHVSVLVRNMPVHDPDCHRRWKENLNLLVGVIDKRVAFVEGAVQQEHCDRLRSLAKDLNLLIDHLRDPQVALDQEAATSRLMQLIDRWESREQPNGC